MEQAYRGTLHFPRPGRSRRYIFSALLANMSDTGTEEWIYVHRGAKISVASLAGN